MGKDNSKIATLGDICFEVKSRTDNPSKSGYERFVGLEHLDTGELTVRRWGNTADVTSSMKLFKAGDVLFARRNAYLKRASRVNFDGVCSGDAIVLRERKDRIVEGFLPLVLNTDLFWNHAIAHAAGSMSKRVKPRDLFKYEFPLPPLNEQRRIAEILWAVEDVLNQLDLVAVDIHQVVFSLGIRYFKQATDNLVKFEDLIHQQKVELTTGPFGTVLKASSYVDLGTPIVNPVNMKDGKLITDEGPFLSEEDCYRLSKYRANEGDTILGRKGEVGRSIYITEDYDGYIIGSDIIRVRPCHEDVLPEYLYYFLRSEQTKAWLLRHSSGTTMPGINERIISQIHMPLPSISEQNHIVSLFKAVDITIKAVENQRQATGRLKRSLLDQLLTQIRFHHVQRA